MEENLEPNFDKVLLKHNNQRKIINEPGDSDWGQLIIPGKNECPNKTNKGLKLLIMASYRTGLLLLKTLISFEEKYPDKLNIVGLITDDPLSPHARISMKRRIWRLFSDNEKLEIEDAIVETALNAGITCYTGSVKTDYARKLLHHWNPDAIQVFVFGQIIDEPFINFPKYGIYNYHPADLLHHLGAGPRPFQDLIDRNASTSLFTIHQLSLQLDAGHVLGQSPVITVKFKNGEVPQNILIIEDKMTEPVDIMAIVLTHQLIENKKTGSGKRINNLDFSSYFSNKQKKKLLEPIAYNKHSENIPEESIFAVNLLDTLWNK